MPHVITITGPSRAGKSTTVDYLLACADRDFKPVLVCKFTTRPPRDDDRDDEVICVEQIPDHCNLVYEQYGARYGLELSTLFEHLAKKQSPIVILNDVRAVEDVRNSFRELVRSIFIFRENPSSEQYHEELIESRGKKAAKPRFEKARTIYRIYIENIHLFDHVIINSGTLEDLDLQVRQIVQGLKEDLNWPLRAKGTT